MDSIPPRQSMQNWTLLAVHQLGGSGHIREIDDQVRKMLDLPEGVADQLYPDGKRTVLDHRIAFARSHLKKQGLLDNQSRSIWALTDSGVSLANEIVSSVSSSLEGQADAGELAEESPSRVVPIEGEEWQDDLLNRILQLSPGAFERLCQRLLRESGFVQVQVTGRTGDGGIDGHGLLQMARLVSFPVLFQCKRWQNSIGAVTVREFRGAMVGRADRGLIITTSTFSTAARKEAVRDGVPPIDLVDGFMLADNLRALKLGVKDVVVVDGEWFDHLETWASGNNAAQEVFGVG